MEKDRGKACWKYTHIETGKVYYTRNRAILEDHIKYNSRDYLFEFLSNTPKAIEILYLEQERHGK